MIRLLPVKKFFRFAVALFTVVSILVYIVWRIGYTIPSDAGRLSLVLAIILLVLETLNAFELLIYYQQITLVQLPKKPKVNSKDFPDVDVFITTLNEPLDILRPTVLAARQMKYPQQKKVHLYICDDGNRAEVRSLARKMQVNYVTRKDGRYAKAGNLNHALGLTHSPLIAIFDADMIPTADFLLETVPYFLGKNKGKIGFVQTPQTFSEPDLFQSNLDAEETLPAEHDYFYKVVQPSKNNSNSVIFCGTNAVIARQALTEAGGFSTKSITEDFATGVEIQSRAYQCLAIEKTLAKGLPPHNLRSLFRQRARWARGNLQAGRRQNLLFRRGFSLRQRLNYLFAVGNWLFPLKQLFFLAAPILFAILGIVFVKCTLPEILIFWLPMYVLTNFSVWYLSEKTHRNRWTRLHETILAPALFVPVLLEIFGLTTNNFVVTSKKRRADERESKTYKFFYALPFLVGIFFTIFGIYKMVIGISAGAINHYIVLFWLVLNFYYLTVALQFILARPRQTVAAETSFGRLKIAPALTAVLLVITILFTSRGWSLAGQTPAEPIAPAPTLARGINLGNSLEAVRDVDWGLTIKSEYFDAIAAAGFDHVRIPVRFQAYLDENGQLEEEFMQTLDAHLKYALERGLTVILDFHHFEEIMAEPAHYQEQFYHIWRQLAQRYQTYPNELVFELLNEPTGLLHAALWNQYATGALAIVRETNPTRTVIIGATNMYSIFDLKLLSPPADDHLILAFNYYRPNDFTFQGDQYHPSYQELSGVEWGSEEDYADLQLQFAAVQKLAEEKGWQIALTEFGVTREVPAELRARWIGAVRREAERFGFSWTYWEFGTGFGIYDLETGEWDEEILPALLDNYVADTVVSLNN